jgi:hypothetical protein
MDFYRIGNILVHSKIPMRKLTGFIIMFLVSAMLLTSCKLEDGACN